MAIKNYLRKEIIKLTQLIKVELFSGVATAADYEALRLKYKKIKKLYKSDYYLQYGLEKSFNQLKLNLERLRCSLCGSVVPEPEDIFILNLFDENDILSEAPLLIYDVNGDFIGIALNSEDVITLWNSDEDNNDITATDTDFVYNGDVAGINALTNTFTSSGVHTFSFGDSSTNPGSAASPSSLSYINQFVSYIGTTINNQGASGNGIWRALSNAYTNMSQVGNNSSVTILAGYNDYRTFGATAKALAMYEVALTALIANCFLGTAVAASEGAVTKTGTFSATYTSSTVGGKANRINSAYRGVILQDVGTSLEWSFTGDNVVLGFIGVDGVALVYGSFEVLIDSVSQGIYDSNDYATGVTLSTHNHQSVPGSLIFKGLGVGAHTIEVVAQADVNATNVVVIDFFGTMKDVALCKPIIIGEVPKMTTTAYTLGTATAGSDIVADAYNKVIGNVVSKFYDYPVAYAPVNSYYDPYTQLSGDNVHPTNAGHAAIYDAFVAVSEIGPPDDQTGWVDIVYTGADLSNSSGIWSCTSSNALYGHTGLGNLYLASGQDGRMITQYLNNTTNLHVVGLNTVNAATAFAGMEVGYYISSTNFIVRVNAGTTASTGVLAISGQYISIVRTGSQYKLQTSPNGTDWTDIHTYSHSSSGNMYTVCDFIGNTTKFLNYPKAVNFTV